MSFLVRLTATLGVIAIAGVAALGAWAIVGQSWFRTVAALVWFAVIGIGLAAKIADWINRAEKAVRG